MAKKQTTINGIPVFQAELADEGMVCISLVRNAAVQKGFLAYAEDHKEVIRYAIADEDKRLVYGVVMRANYPIYRETPEGDPFYIVHTPGMIREMAEKYLVDGNQNEVDTDHDGERVEDVHMVQFFIKDSAKGISPDGFSEIEDGSLFGEFHILNDAVWDKVKDGSLQGFSIEVFEDIVPLEKVEFSHITSDDMAIIDKIRAAFAQAAVLETEPQNAPVQTYGSIGTDKGGIFWDGEDTDLAVGTKVFGKNENDEKIDIEDGDYTTDEGRVIVVAAGEVTEIREPAQQTEEAAAEQTAEQHAEETPEAEQTPAEPTAEQNRIKELEDALEEKQERIAELEQLLIERDARISELETKVEGYKAQPAAPSAHEAFKSQTEAEREMTFSEMRKLIKKK